MITATNITSAGTNTTVYTSSGETGITTLMICNHNAGTTEGIVDVYVVPATQTAGITNQILKSLSIVASDTFVMDMEKLILSNGDTIVVRCNGADVVNCVISSMAVA